VVLQTTAPAVGTVDLGDFPCGGEGVVAGVADVVVARVAGVAVQACGGRGDGVVADVAVLADRQGDVEVFGQVGQGDGGLFGEGAFVGDRQERVGAVVAPVEAGGAVAPGAFEADIAVPVVGVCEGVAALAEGALVDVVGCLALRGRGGTGVFAG
jgi:hypothetical protein